MELEGRRIVKVRPMSRDEAAREGWLFGRHGAAPVLELDDGTVLYPSRDDEGNGPGALFGRTAKGESLTVVTR
jgi:hypothetical protein